MKTLYILNDDTTVVTENMTFGAKVGIKEVHDITALSEEEYDHLVNNRIDFTPITDDEGKLIELQSPKRRIVIEKQEGNI